MDRVVLKHFILGSILLLLFLPLIQKTYSFVELKPLQGAFILEEKPDSIQENWFTGEYQLQYEKYFNENFGFRDLLVRINNQIAFSLFKVAKANGVVIGKEDYLYEENYIKAYYGTDFIGQEKIREQTDKLKKIQDILKSLNKDIFVILAPGKASFLPEFIPDNSVHNKTTTNYQVYIDEFQKNNINYLDFNKWFIQMKSTTKYPLYAKCGIHWSKYGEFLAGDSIVNYIGKLRNINMPELILDSVIVKNINEYGDYDVGEGMNLLFNIETYPMGYPVFHFQPDRNVIQPKVLFVADSYYWGMFNAGFSKDIFNNGQFWYYNQQIYPDSYEKPINVSDVNIREEVEKNDVIVLLSTDANLYKFPFGFIDELYDAYFNPNSNTAALKDNKEKKIQDYMVVIKNTPEWIKMVKEQAKKENIELEQAIRNNAEYMVWKEEGGK